jgi:hypothetical protein
MASIGRHVNWAHDGTEHQEEAHMGSAPMPFHLPHRAAKAVTNLERRHNDPRRVDRIEIGDFAGWSAHVERAGAAFAPVPFNVPS